MDMTACTCQIVLHGLVAAVSLSLKATRLLSPSLPPSLPPSLAFSSLPLSPTSRPSRFPLARSYKHTQWLNFIEDESLDQPYRRDQLEERK